MEWHDRSREIRSSLSSQTSEVVASGDDGRIKKKEGLGAVVKSVA
jgi:hypothetical protein